MKFLKNILLSTIILIIINLIITPMQTKVQAGIFSDILNGGDVFTQSADDKEYFNEENQKKSVDQMYYFLLGLGVIIAIVIGIIIGIQFITTGVEGQAKIKEKLLPYIIGCIIIFGGFGIWRVVLNIANDTLDSGQTVKTEETQDEKPPLIQKIEQMFFNKEKSNNNPNGDSKEGGGSGGGATR